MTPYALSLAIGAVGFATMAIRGLGHFGHHGGGSHGDGGHGDAHAGHSGSGHAADHGADHAATQSTPLHSPLGAQLLALLSPRILFGFLTGAGAAGLILKHWLPEPLVAALALAGGVVFERLVITPLWNLFFRFESAPALTLESAIEDEALAATDFDANGQGLILLELDGQVVQLLGTLRPEDRQAGVRVRRGARVRIEEVDAARNRCVVSFIGNELRGG
jgi:hypothetical protein